MQHEEMGKGGERKGGIEGEERCGNPRMGEE